MLCFVLDIFYMIVNFDICFLYSNVIQKLFSIFSFVGLFLLLLGLFKKTDVTVYVISSLIFVFTVVNQLKIAYMGEVVLPTDILYLNNIGEITGYIEGTMFNMIKQYLIPLAILLVLLLVICYVVHKNNVCVNKKNVRRTCGLGIALLCLLYVPAYFFPNIYLKKLFNTDERKGYDAICSYAGYYATYGIIPGMLGNILESRQEEPENYNEETVNMELANVKNSETKVLGKPNIIVVLSETFWNIDELEEIEFDKSVASNLESLKKEGILFNMISPSYGGLTSNVEFEFLTGANLMYFNQGFTPYLQLYTGDESYSLPSIVHELNNNGYTSKIIACNSSKLYNCGNVHKYLGFQSQEYITDVDEKYTKGGEVSDKYIVDKIIEEFENKSADDKLFYMALTIQGHMPYSKDKYDNYDISIVKSSLSTEMNDTILSYAQGVYDADKELLRLYEYVNSIDEPTVILFFGDHLPYLQTVNGDNVVDYLEYFNTSDETLNNYRKYNTQALLLANFEIEKGLTKNLSIDLVSSYMLNKMDITISNYYIWLYNSSEVLPSSNFLVSQDKEGNIFSTNDLTNNLKEMYDIRKNIQYKMFYK